MTTSSRLIILIILPILICLSGCTTVLSKLPNRLDQQGHYFSGTTEITGRICLYTKLVDEGYEPSYRLFYVLPLSLIDYHFTIMGDILWSPLDWLYQRRPQRISSDELCDPLVFPDGDFSNAPEKLRAQAESTRPVRKAQ